ncbi:MAG: cupin domain-containing protein [Gammaproteobacteria bacterium]|nr:cupin domain-containing protein [Gammaproteobacteria bacterium]
MSHPLSRAADIAGLTEVRHQHQFNDNAIRMTRTLSAAAGLSRLGVHLVRLETGRDSTQFHFHEATEEFIYILSGRGIAQIADESFEIGPGDFMGFTAPSQPHAMHNPFAEDLVYLVGGEHLANDVVHYPKIRRTMIKAGDARTWVDWDHLHTL